MLIVDPITKAMYEIDQPSINAYMTKSSNTSGTEASSASDNSGL